MIYVGLKTEPLIMHIGQHVHYSYMKLCEFLMIIHMANGVNTFKIKKSNYVQKLKFK